MSERIGAALPFSISPHYIGPLSSISSLCKTGNVLGQFTRKMILPANTSVGCVEVRIPCVDKLTLTNKKVLFSCHLGFHSCDKIDVFDSDERKNPLCFFGFILFDFTKNKKDTFW